MVRRLRWIDDVDHLVTRNELLALRQELVDWDWVNFCEEDHKDAAEALLEFQRQVGIATPFAPGKVVCCRRMPSFHAKLAQEIKAAKDVKFIAKDVLVVLVAPIDERTAFYKECKEASKGNNAKVKIISPEVPTRQAAVAWAMKRAEYLGAKMDREASRMLVDQVGFDPNRLTMEIIKLKELSSDRSIPPWAVEQAAHGTGVSDVQFMLDAILKGDLGHGHQFLQRLLAQGDPPMKVLGLLTDWVRKMAIAESCHCDFNSIRDLVASLRRKPADQEKPEDGEEAKTEPMFLKPGAVYYSCQALRESGRPRGWALAGLAQIREAQLRIRKSGADEAAILHDLVRCLMGADLDACSREGRAR